MWHGLSSAAWIACGVALAQLAAPAARAQAHANAHAECIEAMVPPLFEHVPRSGSSRRLPERAPEPQTAEERRALHWLLWPAESEIRLNVERWLRLRNFGCLEQVFADLEAAGATFADQQAKSAAFLGGARDAVEAARGMTADEIADLMRDWLGRYPDSVLAQVLWVRMLIAAAWHARGTGFANTVTPDGWRAFANLNREALVQANALTRPARGNLLGLYVAIRAAQENSIPKERLAQMSLEGLRRFPHELNLPTYAAERLLPRWGGSTKEFEQYARQAREAAGQELGDRVYAFIYTRIASLRDLQNFPEAQLDLVESGLVKLADTLEHEHILMLQNFACRFRRERAVWHAQRLWPRYALEPQVRVPSPELDAVCREWVKSLPRA